ncbi:hypothetical protein GLYMA_01G024200v4 [Glycine max]|uniref:BRX domain-containing protein n=1 Tax=Glycine max TaxID=3847 RepID=A0A0R0LAR8_SOYBN|nr:protein BREVIS RADIX [Glycine max]KAH1161283.1 hypothetical protein GYH30_000251 [Glycine max]KRH74505.1 hypothetical protein GLYMA_01G024200v4 [Glycine max]|eukprot:XP_006573015.1 protein BREVIS RADIX [Glycine max]
MEQGIFSVSESVVSSEAMDHGGGQIFHAGPSVEASRITTSSRYEPSMSNASFMETEWTELDEPGVHLAIRQLADGTRELRRIRFK